MCGCRSRRNAQACSARCCRARSPEGMARAMKADRVLIDTDGGLRAAHYENCAPRARSPRLEPAAERQRITQGSRASGAQDRLRPWRQVGPSARLAPVHTLRPAAGRAVLAAEKSKVPFFIAGGLLVVWALDVVAGPRHAQTGLPRQPRRPARRGGDLRGARPRRREHRRAHLERACEGHGAAEQNAGTGARSVGVGAGRAEHERHRKRARGDGACRHRTHAAARRLQQSHEQAGARGQPPRDYLPTTPSS